MDTQTVWNNLNSEVYFFILKKVKDRNAANDILQNSFLKIQAIPDEFALAPAGGVAAHMSVKTDDAKIGIAQYLRVQKL